MPLKHHTETFLIFLLGVVMALTGLLIATLPDLPHGALPWGILFALTVLYPLCLSKFFRKNRADHLFRLLHWFPAFGVALWMLLKALAEFVAPVERIVALYTWGWTLPLVAIGFVMTIIFCLHVIRRRHARIALLLVAFIPFVVAAATSERGGNWEGELAAMLWQSEWWNEVVGTSATGSKQVAKIDEEDKNFETSEDPAEEAWRERLRAFERRRQRIAARLTDDEAEEDTMMLETPVPADTGTGMELREVKTTPVNLPNSGPLAEAIALTMLALYGGVLHQRVRRRI